MENKIVTVTLKKIEKYWTLIIERENGNRSDYRFNSKKEALKWAKQAGVEEVI